MLKRLIGAVGLCLAMTGVCAGDGYPLKGFEPGAEMIRCPAGYQSEHRVPPVLNSFNCVAIIPNFGGRPVKSIVATVHEARVVSVVVHGFETRSHLLRVVDELSNVYGLANVNAEGYSWRRGNFYFMRATVEGNDAGIVSGHLPSLQRMLAKDKMSDGR
ncbi:MAG: hypothetical protein Q8O29_19090 [Polaromonas sp.]|uniref:hypothetical protein n=1 Tax=Polaromonas sp. TaxID=1869339 RepID=UPI00273666F6|nr:hypothetical protein [Polaromonas sp.]MDP2820338.1 hypothetical protein [Polaromonas sp.]